MELVYQVDELALGVRIVHPPGREWLGACLACMGSNAVDPVSSVGPKMGQFLGQFLLGLRTPMQCLSIESHVHLVQCTRLAHRSSHDCTCACVCVCVCVCVV
jgi:hypothetical protein